MEELARYDVERDRYVLAGLHVAQLIFAQVSGNPPRSSFEKAEQRLAWIDVLPRRQTQVRDDPVCWRPHARIVKIELRLLDSCKSLLHLWIGLARCAEVGDCTAQVRLCFLFLG